MTNKINSERDSFEQIVVIGTSAGGLEALSKLIPQLKKDFPAPILIVQHISPDATGTVLLDKLKEIGSLKCVQAKNNLKIKKGHIYIAQSDYHLMVEDDKILVTKGATENRWRPAIDPLFRSAAVTYSNRVIGVILTGYLDDGTTGVKTI